MDMTTNEDITINRAAVVNINDGELRDDDTWDSDFNETNDELHSQEIEDNKINENREAQFRNISIMNAPIRSESTEDSKQSNSAVTQSTHFNIPTASTGAIPKNGFSYLFNNSNPIQKKDLNSSVFQNITNPVLRDQNTQAGKETKGRTAVIPSRATDSPPIDVTIKTDQTNQAHNTVLGSNNSPKKLKPDAFNFLTRLSTNAANVKIFDERKHLVPTSFVNAGSVQRSQISTEESVSHNTESYMAEPTAPDIIEQDNYEPISDKNKIEQFSKFQELHVTVTNKNHNKMTKPPLPSRPPPVYKYPPELFSKLEVPPSKVKLTISPQVVLLESKRNISPTSPIDDMECRDVQPEVKKAQTQVQPSLTTFPPELLSKPLPPVPILDQPSLLSNASQSSILHKKSSSTTAYPPEFISRPLPLVPISDQSNLLSSALHTAVDQCRISETEETSAEINSTPAQSATLSAIYPSFDKISQVDKLKPVLVNKANEWNPTEATILPARLAPQQRLAQKICKQNNVSNEILLSQHKISSAIASRVAMLQNAGSATNRDSSGGFSTDSLQNSNDVMNKEKYLLNFKRTETSSSEIPKPSIPERKLINSTIREKAIPPAHPDIEALHNAISRPSLPQKLKTTQRSMSCSNLVQSFKDISFAMWNPTVKDKRSSTGSGLCEKTLKDFRKENKNITKGFATSNARREVTEPKQIKSLVDSFTEKNLLSRNPWYHDIDSKEAQQRLLNFIDQNGAFLIRPSTRKTNEIQHTACVVFSGRIINMHIRRKPNGQYALGTEKEGEKTFCSISDLIKYHQDIPIETKPYGQSSSIKSISTCLRVTPPKI